MQHTSSYFTGLSTLPITPQHPVQQSGFAARTSKSTGVHDPLYARAFSISDGATTLCFVVLDILGISLTQTNLIRQRVSAATGVPETAVQVLTTHTHGGPATLPKAYLGDIDQAYLTYLMNQTVTACINAINNQHPATLHYGVTQNNSGKNRRNPEGPTDTDVSVLYIDRGNSQHIAFVSYACHPVVLGPDNTLITRDYPGEIINTLESLLPECTTIVATGCAGQINTGHKATDSWQNTPATNRTFEEAKRIGASIAKNAYQTIQQLKTSTPLPVTPVRHATTPLKLPFAKLEFSVDDAVRAWRAELVSANADRRALLEALLVWAQRREARANVLTEVAAASFGGVSIAVFPGEVFVEYGLQLKALFGSVITLAYGNDNPGYLPTTAAFAEGGYEVADAYKFYGQPAPFVPQVESILMNAMRDLLQELRS